MPAKKTEIDLQLIESDTHMMEMFKIHIGLPKVVVYIDSLDDPSMLLDPYGLAYECNEGGTFDETNLTPFDAENDDSYVAEWLNDGLEGKEDEDIFAEKQNVDEGAITSSSHAQQSVEVLEDWFSDAGEENELHSLDGSSEGEDEISYPEFNEDLDMVKPELKVGMKFTNAQVFREALREWSVQNGYDIKYKRKENARITALGKNDCGWRIHASPMEREKTFQIKSLNPIHKCGRSYNNHLVTSRYLSKKYVEKLRDDPEWKLVPMQRTIQRDLMVNVTRTQVYRAKKKAKIVIEGDHKKQYARLWDYCETVRRYNPNSCLKLMVDRPTIGLEPRF